VSRRDLSNVQVTITFDNPGVTVVEDPVPVALWRRRAWRWMTIPIRIEPGVAPGPVAALATVTADHSDPYEHPFTVEVTAAPPAFEFRSAWIRDRAPDGNADGVANSGERVLPRVRIKNIGDGPGQNVHASLVIVDSDVTVVSGFASHSTWPAGEARNNGFILDIALDATAHDVQAVLSVVADDAGPWTFNFTIPIVASEGGVATSLLANFPNPFNPETWIPFELSDAAETTIRIYDPRGREIRQLDLGWRQAGSYLRRNTAAYWDGRNDLGERVASGVYMYELSAGTHRETRRMTVRK